MARVRQEKRDSLVLTLKGALTLFLILFMIHLSYAGPPVVDKQAGPEKALKKTEKNEASAEKKEAKIEEQYVYSPVGKTDPFESFLSSGKGARGATSSGGKDPEWPDGKGEILKEGPKTELQKIEIFNLTLTAVIKGEGKNWAMVRDPKGRGYFLKKGTKIGTGRGEVDKIMCVEKETHFGLESVRKVVIKEPYLNRDRNIEYRYIEMEMPFATK